MDFVLSFLFCFVYMSEEYSKGTDEVEAVKLIMEKNVNAK